jgi:hypothetical protein
MGNAHHEQLWLRKMPPACPEEFHVAYLQIDEDTIYPVTAYDVPRRQDP